jgi:hypothetical protein
MHTSRRMTQLGQIRGAAFLGVGARPQSLVGFTLARALPKGIVSLTIVCRPRVRVDLRHVADDS